MGPLNGGFMFCISTTNSFSAFTLISFPFLIILLVYLDPGRPNVTQRKALLLSPNDWLTFKTYFLTSVRVRWDSDTKFFPFINSIYFFLLNFAVLQNKHETSQQMELSLSQTSHLYLTGKTIAQLTYVYLQQYMQDLQLQKGPLHFWNNHQPEPDQTNTSAIESRILYRYWSASLRKILMHNFTM